MNRSACLNLAIGLAWACGCGTPEPDSGQFVTPSGVEVFGGTESSRQAPAQSLEIAGSFDGSARKVIRVSGVDKDDLRKMAEGAGDAPKIDVRVVQFKPSDSPRSKPLMDISEVPVSGAVEVIAGAAYFVPQFPFEPGVNYFAQFVSTDGEPLATNIMGLEKESRSPAAEVVAVFPSADTLPENLLKFYLHFSEPMRQGGVYEFIELVDDKGRKADVPFLEVAEELWDSSGQRLTLFIDPGRVKREVKPLEDLGPTMAAGGNYTLRIDKHWPDARGVPLKRGFEKRFRVGLPDRKQPEVKSWKLTIPKAGTRSPLVVHLGEPLDRALLERLLWVEDSDGDRVAGEVSITDDETRWLFAVEGSWADGDYRLVADEWLEDLAGNRIGRPFEVDIFEKVSERIETKTVFVPFAIR